MNYPHNIAVPVLQLDIHGGIYNGAESSSNYNPDYDAETILSNGNKFTLYALMKESNKTKLDDTYYLSMALYPKISQSSTILDLGPVIVKVNGNYINIDVTEDMIYGHPELLKQSHYVFPTYHYVQDFTFDLANKVGEYDTQYNPGGFVNFSYSPDMKKFLYYESFEVDTTELEGGYTIHFDLFNEEAFAPFSHDAESDPPQVPEPATLLLLGLGMIGIAGIRRKFKN